MTCTVVVTKRAQKETLKLQKKDRRRVLDAILEVQENPLSGKQLHGELEGLWAVRVWPYRILYTFEQRTGTVKVVRVGHRQGVYE